MTTILALASCGGEHPRTRPLTSLPEADRTMLEQYEGIRAALAQDDYLLAKRRAASYLKGSEEAKPDPKAPAQEPMTKIANANGLDVQRDTFRAWSTRVIALTNGVEGFYVIHCPVPGCGDWLQKDAKVDNPFMGRVMHDCGEVEK